MSRILKVSQGDYRVQVPSGNDIWLDTGTSAGSVIITGNLDVRGTTATVDSVNTSISDNLLTLNKGESGPGISLGFAGIIIDRGASGQQQLSAKIGYSESVSAFIIQNSSNSTNILADLHLDEAVLNKVSAHSTGITFDLKNTNTVLAVANSTYGNVPYEDRLSDDSLTTKKFVTSYVAAENGHATVNSITQSANSTTLSQVTATNDAIEFYIGTDLISKINANGLYVNDLQAISGSLLTLNSNLTTSNNLTVTGQISLTPSSGTTTISSSTTGTINNMSIGATTASTGKFTILEATTSATMPSGNSNARPQNPAAGNIRYNTELRSFEGYNGTLWGTVGGGLQSSPGIATANYTALSNNLIRANSTAGTFTITLPDSPNDGDVVGIIDVANTFGINPVTVIPGAVGTIEGTNSVILDLDGAFVSFVYISGVTNWKLEQTPTGPSSGSAGLTIMNSRVVSKATTSDATPTALTYDGAAPTANNQLILLNDSTYTFSILVTARRTDSDNESAGYKFEGVIDRNTSAATINFVGTPIKTVLAEDSASWDCNITADTILGGLQITATGEANKTIKWVAVCSTAEVTG